MQDLNNAKKNAEEDRAEKQAAKGAANQNAADAKQSLVDTQEAKAADEAFKKDLDATCAQKGSDFASRQKLRQEEIEAVGKAIEIMGGDAVAGSADKHLPAMLQAKATGRRSLVQLRSVTAN